MSAPQHCKRKVERAWIQFSLILDTISSNRPKKGCTRIYPKYAKINKQSIQNWFKIQAKIHEKIIQKSIINLPKILQNRSPEAPKSRSGGVLGGSGALLGHWRPPGGPKGDSERPLGGLLGPSWRPRWSKLASNTGPKSIKKRCKIWLQKLCLQK